MRVFSPATQIDVPGQTLFDKVSASLLYVGEALSGAGTADNAWLIKRIEFDGTGFPSRIRYAQGGDLSAWDSRASLNYA